MRIDNDIKLDFKDVLVRPKRSTLSSRADVSLQRTYTMKHSGRLWTGVPVIASNMDTTGTFEMAKELAKRDMVTAIHKHYTVEEWKVFFEDGGGKDVANHLIVSTGIHNDDITKLDEILTITGIQTFCIDVANGYSQTFVETLRSLRKQYPDKTILAGNVVTGEMTEELILSGADVVKVGIGPGSVCTTRRIAGVGYPQLSAVIECADAAHGLGGLIISDGGCNVPGDLAKAFGGGSDFVMVGGMLAGHNECSGDTIVEDGKKYKMFYGMSSKMAMTKHVGGVAEYRASEGRTVKVPCKGPVDETAKEILGGLRSTCTYVGAASLKELSKRTTFVRVTQQTSSLFEGKPEAPK